jgi:hypothetical protein
VAYQDYNPAARLHTVMDEAYVHRSEGQSAATVWAQILSIQWPESQTEMLRAGADLQVLSLEVRTKVTGLREKVNVDLVMRHFDQVERALGQWAQITQLNMQQFMAPFEGTGLYCLEVCADALKTHATEPGLEPESLTLLTEKVRDLSHEVSEATDLDHETKNWITERLADIERALSTYKVTGTRGLERAADELLGGLHRRPGLVARLGRGDTAKGIAFLLLLIQTTLQGASTFEQVTAPTAPPPGVTIIVQQLSPGLNVDSLPTAPRIGILEAPGEEP